MPDPDSRYRHQSRASLRAAEKRASRQRMTRKAGLLAAVMAATAGAVGALRNQSSQKRPG